MPSSHPIPLDHPDAKVLLDAAMDEHIEAPMDFRNADLLFPVGARSLMHPAREGFADQAIVMHWHPDPTQYDNVVESFHLALSRDNGADLVRWIETGRDSRWQKGRTGLRVYRKGDGIDLSFRAANSKRYSLPLHAVHKRDFVGLLMEWLDGELPTGSDLQA